MREKVKANQSFLFLASVSFDISLLEICLPLTQGSKVVIATEEQFATKELAHLVKNIRWIMGINAIANGSDFE